MRRKLIFIVLLAAFTLPCAAQSQPAPGGIRVLPGYTHRHEMGFDSSVGTIKKPNGLSIHYDIGEMAGVYTDCKLCGWTDGELWRRKQMIGAHPVVIVYTKAKRLVVSFPEQSANFHAIIKSESDLTDMLLMVLTFRSDTQMP